VQLRTALRLRTATRRLESDSAVKPLRYQETINGRSYVIEVLPVGRDRWRAQIARVTGGTTALMPFYGTTPDEAAQQLSGWLTQAGHRH
jgi:hypothetical protein